MRLSPAILPVDVLSYNALSLKKRLPRGGQIPCKRKLFFDPTKAGYPPPCKQALKLTDFHTSTFSLSVLDGSSITSASGSL